MKSLDMLGILTLIVSIFGVIPMVEAHPHATIDLMESHSHDVLDDNFQEDFIVHSFEHVLISTYDFIISILFG
jgi:hypothetical protein